MSEPLIFADHLSKTYRVSQRPPGLKASLAGLFRRTYHDVPAVTDVTFAIAPGEVVGFIGPNGAGKTTTLKLLAGLLQPSAGVAHVAGFTPGERRPDYLRRIALVMGNKSQMLWDIPALDTFHVLGEIYAVPRPELNRTVDELASLLGLESLLTTPVRNLSLGERMKCELVASLLHRPQVLFLDEPTLGLDVSSQRRLRAFIAEYNRRWGATILLTSHYMADVVELCPRVLLIQEGKLLYDGPLPELSARLAPFKLVRLTLSADAHLNGSLPRGAVLVEQADQPEGAAEYPAGTSLTLRIDRDRTAAIIAGLLTVLPIADLVVEDPPIEAVIDQIYTGGLL
jgi:ABC-2 type transport system ATP-binding protein